MRFLLTYHVIVTSVFSFDRSLVRFLIHAREFQLAFADFSVPFVRSDFRELKAFGPKIKAFGDESLVAQFFFINEKDSINK